VRVERRPVDRLVACAAGPCCVAAAVTETSLMPDENCTGAKQVAVGAARGRVGDPLPSSGLNKITEHGYRL
jgi:hypothetical protein